MQWSPIAKRRSLRAATISILSRSRCRGFLRRSTHSSKSEMSDRPGVDDSERLYKALQVQLRQDFVAPAASITGFADILIDETDRLKLSYADDLQRIKTAGENLQSLLTVVLRQQELP